MVVPSDPQREQVLRLIDEKDRIEKKIAELGLTLQKVRKLKKSNSISIFCEILE
jgi:hypothetical protein